MNNELILINIDDEDNQTVSGRELHKFLEVGSRYNDWFKRMCEYGFTENEDYKLVTQKRETNNPKNPYTEITDHILTLNMAKELCMLARNEKGKQARQYFLEVERDWNTPEKVMARALKIANNQLRQVKAIAIEQQKQLDEAKPKVIFADAVSASGATMLVGELAKILKQNGVNIGQKRLFAWLRDKGYLIKAKCADYNKPTQRSMDMGLFKIKKTTVVYNGGYTSTVTTTKLTGKGQQYFINKFFGCQERW